MRSDTVEFWNDIWSTMDHTFADHDELLAKHTGHLKPGRALDLGCGSGGNAIWLAQRGWQVTAVDFSDVAIEKGKAQAADKRVGVEFVASDVTTYQPDGLYDLIISFYIHLWPNQRAQMLSRAAQALTRGGKLLFVSHDQSSPPLGWDQDDLESLTSPDEVATELTGLRIELAEVVEETGAHAKHMPDSVGSEEDDNHHERRRHSNEEHEHHSRSHGATTLVVGVKDK